MIRTRSLLIALFVLALPTGCSRGERAERSEDPISAEDAEVEQAEDAAEPEDDDESVEPEPDPVVEVDVPDAQPAVDAGETQDASQNAEDAASDELDAAPDAQEDASAEDAGDADAMDAAEAVLDASDASDASDADAADVTDAGGNDAERVVYDAGPDPACGTDQDFLEPNSSFASLILLGATNFDTGSLYRLNSCGGDVDYLLIGHLGGSLSVAVTGDVDLQVLPAMVDEAATRAEYLTGDRRFILSGVGAALTSFESVPAGFYLLRVSGWTRARATYSLNVTHGCAGDGYDSPGAADTSAFATLVNPRFVRIFDQPSIDVPTAESANLCLADVDAYQFRPRKTGTAVIEMGNAANIRATVTRLSATGTETPVTGVVESANGTARTLRVANVDPAVTYVVRVAEITRSASTQPYTFLVRFEYAIVTNDQCSTAQDLAVTQTEAVLETDNIGTQSQVASACNGDSLVTDPTLAGRDVFFWFRVTTPSSLSFDLAPLGDASDPNPFLGSAMVYAAPGRVCPSSFSQLLPLGYDGRQAANAQQAACALGRLRISDLPAGDYLLVVDGIPGYAVHGSTPVPPAQGRFRLRTQAFAAAFPAPQSCAEATEISLPARGSASAYRVSPGDEAKEALFEYGTCTNDAPIRGGERIITFTATESGTLSITSAGELGSAQAPFFDSVLALGQGECRYLHPPQLLACQDDDGQSLNSALSVSVRAGERYFLSVDYWRSPGDPLPTPTIVTFSLQ